MSSERDAGLQALQQGNFAAAVPLLEAACQQSPNDFESRLYLGAAYGQLGRQMDAINTITQAVQIQPANPQARYNLAIAMEQGGYREQAVQALQQALTLQPDYSRAREALQRLQGGTPPQPAPAPPAATPETASGPVYVPASGQSFSSQEPSAPGMADAPSGGSGFPPAGFGQVTETPAAPNYGQPEGFTPPPPPGSSNAAYPGAPAAPGSGQPLYGAPPSASSPYGQPPPTETYGAAPAGPLYGAPAPNPYAPPAAAPYGAPTGNPYGAPGAERPGAYGQVSPYGATAPQREYYEDRFDLAQAAKDWAGALTRPGAFFRQQTGRAGMLEPLALMLLYLIPAVISNVLQSAQLARAFAQVPQLAPLFAGGSLVFLMIGLPIVIAMVFLFAGVLHLVGKMFGNASPYSASFRALIFAWAPMPIIGLITALIPVTPGQPNPISGLLALAGFIWFFVLLVMALSSAQEISGGAAFGVAAISFIGFFVLFFVIMVTIGIILGVLIAATTGASHGMSPTR